MPTSTSKPPTLFWIITVLALIWNIMGVMAYLGQVYITDEILASLPEADQLYIKNVESWVTAAYATAVFSGVFGCIALLVRKKIAKLLFIISLIAFLAQSAYNFFIQEFMEVQPLQMAWSFIILSICIFLVWYATIATKRAWVS
ncbi:hypothetical protein SAMN06265371_101398 [Lutibacter agarilyticus]|uniref:Sugar transporter n=1 Tax=Lutibacter agarilyticus TaxID=1109740 RepID=A0A238VH06_9FLAO|nr:hypothetical protein [Lutibacter agarilyticus]SNR33481.1 hypothetical protein SAMN06265371_101398 [Lutibacter agarilyticus]